MPVTGSQWRRCSACKKPIEFGKLYWICSISTCNRKRTALAFCSVSCWEVHLPDANHRQAWALEKTAPRTPTEPKTAAAAPQKTGGRKQMDQETSSGGSSKEEVLIVASRLKQYVKAKSGFSTSDKVLGPLSEIVRRVVDQAIQNATQDGRKTVLDRDIPQS